MDNTIKSLSEYRLSKSKSDLEAAKILFQSNLFAQSVNRSYYSIFHAVRAMLAFDRFDSKKHSGIIAYFNEHYIKTGFIEKEYSVYLMSAERIRTESDYDDLFVASKDQAEKQIENAKKFIMRISSFIMEKYSSSV